MILTSFVYRISLVCGGEGTIMAFLVLAVTFSTLFELFLQIAVEGVMLAILYHVFIFQRQTVWTLLVWTMTTLHFLFDSLLDCLPTETLYTCCRTGMSALLHFLEIFLIYWLLFIHTSSFFFGHLRS